MTWALVRQQLRAQRRFVIWTGALVALAVALAGTGAIATTTQVATDRLASSAVVGPEGQIAGVYWWTNGEPAVGTGTEPGAGATQLAPGELEAMVDHAIAAGFDAYARHVVPARVETPPDNAGFPLEDGATGVYPASAMARFIIDGHVPDAGGLVLAADRAQKLDVSIGDDVNVIADTSVSDTPRADPPNTSTTVAGLSHSSAWAPFSSWSPSAYLPWEDALALRGDAGFGSFEAVDPGERTQHIWADVAWERGAPGFEALEAAAEWDRTAGTQMPREYALSSWALVMIVAAALVAVATIGATVAMARSHAQARVEWVATARVLGARRRTIVAASVLEAFVVGAMAVVVGLVIAYGAVAGLLAAERVAAPGVTLPTMPALDTWGILPVSLLGLGLSVLASAVPAFWASRTPPVAALKNVRPLADAPLSRTLRVRWLVTINVVVFVLIIVALAVDAFALPGIGQALAPAAWVTGLVLVVADVVELCRHAVPRTVARISRRPRPWAVVLGARHDSRRRQWAAAASITAITVGGIIAGLGTAVHETAAYVISPEGRWDDDIARWSMEEALPGGMVALGIVGAVAIAVLVGVAVIATARAAGSADAAVHAALGLSNDDARRTSAAEVAAPLGTGACVGAAAGWAGLAIAHAILTIDPGRSIQGAALGAGLTLLSAALVLVLSAVPITAAAVIAATVPVRSRTATELARVG